MTTSPVHSFDEWSPLEEVIVGDVAETVAFELDRSFAIFFWENVAPVIRAFRRAESTSDPVVVIESRYVEELREDLAAFVSALADAGVSVRRPVVAHDSRRIKTPYWSAGLASPLNVRDQTLILGDTIVETAPQVRSRLFENDQLRGLFLRYFADGARWVSMPRPTLAGGTIDSTYFALSAEDESLVIDVADTLPDVTREIALDAAQCIRLGHDVLVNVANANHMIGYDWLVREFGHQFSFHRLDAVTDGHIDSYCLPLRPGLWLVRDRTTLEFLPEPFRKWDYVVAPPPAHDQFPDYRDSGFPIASHHIDMNVLSISPEVVIANALYPELITALEHRRLTVIPVRHRHRRLFGGGFHCFTLDVRRQGGCESYT